jgi:prenyltransferase beta subunit
MKSAIRQFSLITFFSALICAICGSNCQAAGPGPVLPELVTADVQKAIDKGLNYLAKTQRADGSWLSQGYQGSYPSVATSLAAMAMLSSGSTPSSGPYAHNVSKAMRYLLSVAEAPAGGGQPDGLIAGPGSEGRSMYGHGFATLFLAQCCGMGIDKETEVRLHTVLDRAVKVIQNSQSNLGPALKGAGGWYYTPDGKNDEGSVTVTQLQALRACRNVGIKVNANNIERAVAYLKYCQNPDGGICYSAASRGSSTQAISAAAIACFYASGIYDRAAGGAEGTEAVMVDKLIKYVRQNVVPNALGGGQGHDFYIRMYLSEAWYVRGASNAAAAGEWKEYYRSVTKKLLNEQAPDGSWAGDQVGTAYGTGIAVMVMELPYGYLPICQK